METGPNPLKSYNRWCWALGHVFCLHCLSSFGSTTFVLFQWLCLVSPALLQLLKDYPSSPPHLGIGQSSALSQYLVNPCWMLEWKRVKWPPLSVNRWQVEERKPQVIRFSGEQLLGIKQHQSLWPQSWFSGRTYLWAASTPSRAFSQHLWLKD